MSVNVFLRTEVKDLEPAPVDSHDKQPRFFGHMVSLTKNQDGMAKKQCDTICKPNIYQNIQYTELNIKLIIEYVSCQAHREMIYNIYSIFIESSPKRQVSSHFK